MSDNLTSNLGVHGRSVTVMETPAYEIPPKEPRDYTFEELRGIFDSDDLIPRLLDEIERLQQRVAELTKANAELALLLSQPPTADRICDDELKITYEHGQPYGIRDRGGYLFFFSKISKYSGQEERYRDEVAQAYKLADFLLRSLQRVAVTKDATNGGMMPTCPNCGHDPCADWCKADEQHTDSLIEKLESVVGDETSACSECKNPLQPGDPICVYCGAEQP